MGVNSEESLQYCLWYVGDRAGNLLKVVLYRYSILHIFPPRSYMMCPSEISLLILVKCQFELFPKIQSTCVHGNPVQHSWALSPISAVHYPRGPLDRIKCDSVRNHIGYWLKRFYPISDTGISVLFTAKMWLESRKTSWVEEQDIIWFSSAVTLFAHVSVPWRMVHTVHLWIS